MLVHRLFVSFYPHASRGDASTLKGDGTDVRSIIWQIAEKGTKGESQAIYRALNIPKSQQDMVMRKGGRAPEKYRGVEYSVAKKTEGLWTWTLHPPAERGSPVISGTAKGMNQNAAVDAAYRAIDKTLGTQRR